MKNPENPEKRLKLDSKYQFLAPEHYSSPTLIGRLEEGCEKLFLRKISPNPNRIAIVYRADNLPHFYGNKLYFDWVWL